MNKLGERIKDLIEEKGLEQKEVAKKINMSASQFSRNLKNGIHAIETLERISDVLKVPMTYWFEEQSNILQEQSAAYGEEQIIIDYIRLIKENKRRIKILEQAVFKKDYNTNTK